MEVFLKKRLLTVKLYEKLQMLSVRDCVHATVKKEQRWRLNFV